MKMLPKPFSDTWDCPVCHALCGERVESCIGGIDIHDSEIGDPTHRCDVCGKTQSLPDQLSQTLPCESLEPLIFVPPNCKGTLHPWPVNDQTHSIVYRPEYVERLRKDGPYVERLSKERDWALKVVKALTKIVQLQTQTIKDLRFAQEPCQCSPRLTWGQWFIAAGFGVVLGLALIAVFR